jgi:hypothetical protein
MLKKKVSKGQTAVPFFILIVVAFGFLAFLFAGFASSYSQNQNTAVTSGITGFGELNASSPFNRTMVTAGFDTCNGMDIICNFGNIYKVLSVNSSDPLFSLLIIAPIGIAGAVIILWWLRGTSL